MDEDIKGGFFLAIIRIVSFVITAAIGGVAGLSITGETIPAALFAIGGGFIGNSIVMAWWRTIKGPSVGSVLKAFMTL